MYIVKLTKWIFVTTRNKWLL